MPTLLVRYILFSLIHRLISRVAGTVLGVALLVTFVISVAAIIQRNHVTIGLVILNYVLVADVFAIGIIGSFIWFYTLRERNNFHIAWAAATPATRLFLQDHVCILSYAFLYRYANYSLVQMLWLLQRDRFTRGWRCLLHFPRLYQQPQCHCYEQFLRNCCYRLC